MTSAALWKKSDDVFIMVDMDQSCEMSNILHGANPQTNFYRAQLFFRDTYKSTRSFTTLIYTYMSSLYRPRPLLGVQAGWESQASHRETSPQSPEISLSCIWARRQRQRQSSTWFNIWLKWYEHRPRSAWLQCAFASRSSSPCDTQNYNTHCFHFILNFHFSKNINLNVIQNLNLIGVLSV